MATHWYPAIVTSGIFLVSRTFGIIILGLALVFLTIISTDPLNRFDMERIEWIFVNREISHAIEVGITSALVFCLVIVSVYSVVKIRNVIEAYKDSILTKTTHELSKSKLMALKNISAGIAHEINNPLTIILNCINRLRSDFYENDLDAQQLDNLCQKIDLNIMRITSISQGLGVYGQKLIDSNFQVIKIEELKSKYIEELNNWLNSKEYLHLRSLVKTNFSLDDSQTIECLVDNLAQALVELVGNALEASLSADNPAVEFNITRSGDYLEFSVVNNFGNNQLNKDVNLSKVVQPFYTLKTDKPRIGMGLTIADNIIKFHHGRLYVSTDREKTEFLVKIPTIQLARDIGLEKLNQLQENTPLKKAS